MVQDTGERQRARATRIHASRASTWCSRRAINARITPDIGEARITAAAPYKAAITPSGSLSGAGLRDLPGPTSLSYGFNQQYDKYRFGLNRPYSISWALTVELRVPGKCRARW